MAKNRKIHYWDSCSFIAWLNGGQGHPKEVLAGLDEIAKEVTENRANLCTSVNTQTEILQGKLTPDQKTKLQNIFKRRNVSAINVDSRIAQKASDIRNYYSERGINIKTPDAQHLATAIIYKVDEFNTLDGDGARQRPSDLLRLNGNVAGESLFIRVPTALQGSLFTNVQPVELDSNAMKNDDGIKDKKDAEPRATQVQGSDVPPSENKTGEIKTEENGEKKARTK